MNAIEKQKYLKTPFWGKVSMVFLFLVIIGIVMYYVAYFTERNPLVYPNIPFPTDQAAYLPGEEVVIDVQRCVDYPLNYSFSARLVLIAGSSEAGAATLDGSTVSVPMNPQVTYPFCERLNALRQVLPEKTLGGGELVSGDYRIEYDIFNIQGRFRKHKMSGYTREFRIERTEKKKNEVIRLDELEEKREQDRKIDEQRVLQELHQEQSQSTSYQLTATPTGKPTPQDSIIPNITLPHIIPTILDLPLPTVGLRL